MTRDWSYAQAKTHDELCRDVRTRLRPAQEIERRVPLRLKSLETVLNPQPATAAVLHEVLQWIRRCDEASQASLPMPATVRLNGESLFPEGEWWLTELEKRRPQTSCKDLADDVNYESGEVTSDADKAWWRGGASDSGDDSGASEQSDTSLPAGPRLQRRRHEKTNKSTAAISSARTASSSQHPAKAQKGGPELLAAPPIRRLRGKQKSLSAAPQVVAEDTFSISADAVQEAPGWMRRAAKEGRATVVSECELAAPQVVAEDTFPISVSCSAWRSPAHTNAPLPELMGVPLTTVPAWYNHADSNAVTTTRQQISATCGLHAVNHAIAGAAACGAARALVLRRDVFEAQALAAGIADDPAHLITQGSANYDWAVLHYHLGEQRLQAMPMTPADLQGETAGESRLLKPFSDYYTAEGSFLAVAYILRTPQAGGHWITIVPPMAINDEPMLGVASILCDSLLPTPFALSPSETEDLLTACALECAAGREDNEHGANVRWACFLVTYEGRLSD